MKSTVLAKKHIELGAKMTDFAGYNMPLQYSSVSEEHLMVRSQAGIFDVSHMGEFIIKGREALDLIQYVTSNDASVLKIGDAQYSCLPNESGGIIDDLLVYRLSEDQCNDDERAYMLVVNASNIEKDLAWITSHNSFETRVVDISDQTGLLALQGPAALTILKQHTDLDLAGIKYYSFAKGEVAECQNVLVSATGYTGAGGFEIYAANEDIVKIWDRLFEAHTPDELLPAGLGARDTLRLEMGYCLYGNDIDDHTSPLEAGLGWITKLAKPNFICKQCFLKQKEDGVVRKLVGFLTDDRRVPRQNYLIENEEGRPIGRVTSGTFSPSLNHPIGLGYVEKKYSKPGTGIFFAAGRKKIKATITKLPFLKV